MKRKVNGRWTIVVSVIIAVLLVAVLMYQIPWGTATPTQTASTARSFGEIVNRSGHYEFPNGSSLAVEIVSGIVNWKLYNAQSQEVLSSDANISHAQRWGMVMDADGWLWVNSADIGSVVWVPDAAGGFRKQVAEGREVDPAVKARRPSVLKWYD